MDRLDTPLHFACRVGTKSARVIMDVVRRLPFSQRRDVLLAKNAAGETPFDVLKIRISKVESLEAMEPVESSESSAHPVSSAPLVSYVPISASKSELHSLLDELCDLMKNLVDKSVVVLKQSVSLSLGQILQKKLQDLQQGIKAKIFYLAHDSNFLALPKCEDLIEKAFYKSVGSSTLQEISKKRLQTQLQEVLVEALDATKRSKNATEDYMVKLRADKSLDIVGVIRNQEAEDDALKLKMEKDALKKILTEKTLSRPYQTILEYCEDIQFHGLHFKWSEVFGASEGFSLPPLYSDVNKMKASEEEERDIKKRRFE